MRVTSQHREGESDLSQDAFEGSDFGAEAQMCIHFITGRMKLDVGEENERAVRGENWGLKNLGGEKRQQETRGAMGVE